MGKQLRALGRQSLVYGLSSAAVQVVGLVTLPVFTRVFAPAEYGVIELASVFFAALLVIIDAGLGSAMQRSFFLVPETEPERRRLVVSTAVLSSTLFAAFIGAVLVVAREPLSVAVFGTGDHGDVVALLGLAIPFAALATFLRDVLRLRFQPGHFAVSATLAAAVTAAVGLVGVLVLGGDETAVVAGFPAGQAAAALYAYLVVRGSIGVGLSRAQLGEMLRWGLPLVPATAAMWGMSFLDRLALVQLDGLAATGEYAVATRLGSVLMFVVGAFGTAYTPFLFSQHAESPERERVLRARALTLAAAGFLWVAVALGLFAREVIEVVAPDYDGAYAAAGVLCLGIAAFGLTPLLAAGIQLAGRTWFITRYTVIMVGVNLALCLVLIPPFGFIGAALATAGGYCGLALLYLHRSERLDPAGLPGRQLLALFVLAAALLPLGLLDTGNALVDVAAKLGGLVAFAAGVVALGAVTPAQLRDGRRALARPRRRTPSAVG